MANDKLVEQKLKSLQTAITVALSFIILLSVGVSAVMFTQTYRLGQDSARFQERTKEAHAALCAFKVDLEKRHANGLEFLREHPNGIPGITAAELQRAINTQKATLDALGILNCRET